MIDRLILTSLAATLLIFSVAAKAQLQPQVQTGSRVPVQPRTLDPDDAGVVRKHFAECVYEHAKPKAVQLLAHSDIAMVDLSGAGIKNVGDELNMEECLGQQVGGGELEIGLQFTPDTLRDLMAEEDYLARHRVAPQATELASPFRFTALSTDKNPSTAQALAEFSDCTIRRDLAGADALLRTMPGSRKERDAATSLSPALGACLVVGQKLTLTPASIRALIAYAMWSRFG